MGRSFIVCALAGVFSAPLLAQTDSVVAGVVADSSIAAPVVMWNRVGPYGDTVVAGVNGWTFFSEATRPIAPRARVIGSIELTPLRAHSSNRMYAAGERMRGLEFRDTSIEATLGRVDTFGERWISDVRGVVRYERLHGSDAATREFWSSPYAGFRTRQSYRHITAEDPLLLTFDGSEVAGEAEVFAGQRLWSRLRFDQRASRRFGRFRVGESATLFSGHSINTVNAFLAGGSWPVPGLRPLYGYRYAELRLDHGAGVNGDLQYALRDSLAIAAHASVLKSPGLVSRGVAVDVAGSWRGIGLRVGIALPVRPGRVENRPVVYGSLLASTFTR